MEPWQRDTITPYDTAEVCRAAGLLPKTFDGWLLRRSLPLLPPGPGTGRSRRYSLLDVVRIAAAADLTRQGVSIAVAANIVGNISDNHIAPATKRRWALIAGPQPDDGPDNEVILCHYKTWAEIELDSLPTTFTWLDVTAIAARTLAALEEDRETRRRHSRG
jgi:MerR HTH family regulatory protein